MLNHHYSNSSQITVMINNHSNDLLRADAGCAKPCHSIWRWAGQRGVLEGEYVLVFTVWKGGLHFTALQLLNMQKYIGQVQNRGLRENCGSRWCLW